MTEQRIVHRDAGTGGFVSASYAEANPDTTISQAIAAPETNRVDAILAEITALVDSEPMVTIAVAGEVAMGTSPVDVAETVLRRIRARLEGEQDGE